MQLKNTSKRVYTKRKHGNNINVEEKAFSYKT